VSMQPDRHAPREAGKRHPQQYTTSTAAALSREPEAIPEEEQARISDEARRGWQVLKGEELARKESRSRLGRLRQVEQRARTKGIDIYRLTVAIRREIAAAEVLVEGGG
jgi:hypothetical protein